jgi:hypothetical protein
MSTHPRFRTVTRFAMAIAAASAATMMVSASSQKFYDDDPVWEEPSTQDASGMKPTEVSLFVDLAYNITKGGDVIGADRARNVNTVDEVPDSSWFTNRILARPVSADEAVRGPLTGTGPAPGTWSVVRPKEAGFAPGFTMRDASDV